MNILKQLLFVTLITLIFHLSLHPFHKPEPLRFTVTEEYVQDQYGNRISARFEPDLKKAKKLLRGLSR